MQVGAIEWSWYVPVDGDGHHVGTFEAEIFPSIGHLTKVIQTAEQSGFDTVLIPTQLYNNCFHESAAEMDTWTVASALAMVTERIRLLTATKVGQIRPALLAKMGATLDHVSNGRFAFNITTGGMSDTQYGETLDHDERYERTKETIQALKSLWTQERTTFQGKYVQLEHALSSPKPIQKPYPPIYFAGVSEAAKRIAAAEADVHLMQGEPPHRIEEHIVDLRRRAAELGRTLRFGVRLQVIMRDTEAEAMRAAEALLSRVDDRVLSIRSQVYKQMDSVQTKRLHADNWDTHWVAPNLWGGMRTVRAGAGNALVGTPDQLAERCLDHIRVGISTFIFSGYPQADEARRVGEQLIPLEEKRLAASANGIAHGEGHDA